MIHARKDYNRFQDPAIDDPSLLSAGSTPIGEDEPVMLFRAQDVHFTDVLDHYSRCLARDGNEEMYRKVREHIALAQSWQINHTPKKPDLPK